MRSHTVRGVLVGVGLLLAGLAIGYSLPRYGSASMVMSYLSTLPGCW